ncbi:hypothetical protein CISG_05420 [Coccidioides immitis RMSCC 3703]|uniref:Uncharacterized protein n=2 Tax=Coccidioides immitis TaxID=5501 RepID=A0A0J8QV20_COCIT|nr:hypothetical protein CIRG_00686 [Coccidioides immitis RMSCC 2394]KMU75935.1 hypothetical protein CISG_05420 [Coccidioides immitis RMSCC 3703]
MVLGRAVTGRTSNKVPPTQQPFSGLGRECQSASPVEGQGRAGPLLIQASIVSAQFWVKGLCIQRDELEMRTGCVETFDLPLPKRRRFVNGSGSQVGQRFLLSGLQDPGSTANRGGGNPQRQRPWLSYGGVTRLCMSGSVGNADSCERLHPWFKGRVG